jgi:hypothetical protein
MENGTSVPEAKSAGQLFRKAVDDLMRDRQAAGNTISYNDAWKLCRLLHRSLWSSYEEELSELAAARAEKMALDEQAGQIAQQTEAVLANEREKRQGLVKDIMEKRGLDYHTAYKEARRRQPHLFPGA